LLRGTPNLRTSLIASVSFTVLSTLFNLYAMRRGALLVGAEGGSVGADFRRMPRLITGFLAAGPIAVSRLVCHRPVSSASRPTASRSLPARRSPVPSPGADPLAHP
jgi:hypothetical protein